MLVFLEKEQNEWWQTYHQNSGLMINFKERLRELHQPTRKGIRSFGSQIFHSNLKSSWHWCYNHKLVNKENRFQLFSIRSFKIKYFIKMSNINTYNMFLFSLSCIILFKYYFICFSNNNNFIRIQMSDSFFFFDSWMASSWIIYLKL